MYINKGCPSSYEVTFGVEFALNPNYTLVLEFILDFLLDYFWVWRVYWQKH